MNDILILQQRLRLVAICCSVLSTVLAVASGMGLPFVAIGMLWTFYMLTVWHRHRQVV
ncbi:hypothetical protein Pan44_28240 [Caulifigura coniformis]|uniref:Uncharacterized protein n=1 Tax=Caulifigura coniformis TaxID=2527983 RepID=A0A517SF77_9PLAN|nr:hypothetical protein Pan44_28240 [Caulifigura coniformis]